MNFRFATLLVFLAVGALSASACFDPPIERDLRQDDDDDDSAAGGGTGGGNAKPGDAGSSFGDAGGTGGGDRFDAGDTFVIDGGSGGFDAGEPIDAGAQTDSGQIDAGVSPVADAGILPPDAGSTWIPTDAGVVQARLPHTLHASATFFDGQRVWIVGGRGDNTMRNGVLSFDPVTETTTTHNATLPSGRQAMYFASSGSTMFMFGGESANGLLREIVRFDASTLTLTTMTSVLPSARYHGSAIWVGPYIYLFGGWDGGTQLSQILRYDPVQDVLVELPSTSIMQRELPSLMHWNGSIYVWGGFRGNTDLRTSAARFDIATGAITTLTVQNPHPRLAAGFASDGRFGYQFGGMINGVETDTIVRFDPVTETFAVAGTLALRKHGNPYVFVGDRFYTFGAHHLPQWVWSDQIQRWVAP